MSFVTAKREREREILESGSVREVKEFSEFSVRSSICVVGCWRNGAGDSSSGVDTVGFEIRRFGRYSDDPRKSTMYRPIRDATGAGDLQDCWPVTAC